MSNGIEYIGYTQKVLPLKIIVDSSIAERNKKNMKIMPDLFMVRIDKEKQKAAKEKLSSDSPFFIPVGSIHNSRNMEHGEIVQIGSRINIYGWDSIKVGDTLIFHYSIETPQEKSGKRFFLYEDQYHNYYAVDIPNVRGYYNGTTIIPHPDFVFLKNIPAFENQDEIDSSTGNKVKKSDGGIFMVTNWNDSPQDIAQRSQKIKERIESLTKSKRTPEIQNELERLEAERQTLNRKAQKHEFLPYRVAWANKKLERDFGVPVGPDDILYTYNKAALYLCNFQLESYKYIIALVDHVGGLKERNQMIDGIEVTKCDMIII